MKDYHRDFDSLTKNEEAEMKSASAWKRATDFVFLGLLLSAVSLFGGTIAFALPGLLLTFLGFRSLRSENEHFRRAGNLTFTRLCLAVAGTVIDATVFRSHPIYSQLERAIFFLDGVLLFCSLFFLWKGIGTVRKELRISMKSSGIKDLLMTGGVFIGLSFFYSFFVIPVRIFIPDDGRSDIMFYYRAFLLFFVVVFRTVKCYRLSQEIDRTGYTVDGNTLGLSNKKVAGAVLLTAVCGVLLGLLFFQKYPMRWRMLEEVSDTRTDRIREELAALGFPQEILSDLGEEDILQCEGAKQVVVNSRNHPMNDGREIVEKTDREETRRRVYDKEELKITGIAVELSDERPSWRIFHHFLWEENPGFVGTEAIRIRTGRMRSGWNIDGAVEGRVLYEKAESTFISDNLILEEGNHVRGSDHMESSATFSFPRRGERQRGYVTYLITESGMRAIIDCPIDYVHQSDWKQFPVMTTKEYVDGNGASFWNVFQKTWDSVQFYPKDISEEKRGAMTDRDRCGEGFSGLDCRMVGRRTSLS